jgi:hypothetical protein
MEKNKKDQRNSLLGLLLVAGVVFYIWKTRKPKAYAVESGESGGGSGGGGGAFPVFIPTPAPAPAPAPAPQTNTWPTCKTGERYNPATRKCEPIIDVPMSEQTAKDAMKQAQTGGGLSAYDPCKSNGYGGTYDPATNSCKLSPYCGGGTLKLDSNGKAAGCEIKLPTTGGGGVVAVGFSGKMPLTIENILH